MAGQSNSGRFTEWLVNQIGENLKLHFCQLVLIDLAFTNVQYRYILYSTGTYSTVQCTVPVHMYCTVPVHMYCTLHSTGAYVICIFGITNVDDNSVTIVNGKYRHKTELIILS